MELEVHVRVLDPSIIYEHCKCKGFVIMNHLAEMSDIQLPNGKQWYALFNSRFATFYAHYSKAFDPHAIQLPERNSSLVRTLTSYEKFLPSLEFQ